MDDFLCDSSTLFILQWVLLVIGVSELWSMDLVSRLPGVICFQVAYPFDEVLESSSPSGMLMINDPFDLVLLFSFDKVRRWPRVVRSMYAHFMIGG